MARYLWLIVHVTHHVKVIGIDLLPIYMAFGVEVAVNSTFILTRYYDYFFCIGLCTLGEFFSPSKISKLLVFILCSNCSHFLR